MTSPTWQNRLDDLLQFNRQDMYQNVDARIDEAFDILDTFLTNRAKPLTEFVDYADAVKLVGPSGEPKVKLAPFIAAHNEREQLKAIFEVELHKQWDYTVGEFEMMHKRCMHHISCWLTFTKGYIPDIPASNIRNNQIKTFIGERQIWRKAFHKLVDQFLNETKRNLKQAIEEKVPAWVGYAGGDDPYYHQLALNMYLSTPAPLWTVEEYRVFARSEATSKVLNQSINRFLLKLKQTFVQLHSFQFKKMQNEAARDNQQNEDASMEDK